MALTSILVTGGTGQIGQELLRHRWPDTLNPDAPTRELLELTDQRALEQWISERNYAAVINCAAFTAVDRAETEPELAFALNAELPRCLARITRALDIPLIHISTDYVFDGEKAGPYFESDPVNPVSVYGRSKAAGEEAVTAGNEDSLILRTAWVLSPHRSNFLKTMLQLARTRTQIGVVDDQFGSPTSASDIAACLIKILAELIGSPGAPRGIYHFVNAGVVSWCGLAREIFAIAEELGMPSAQVKSITTAEYPTPTKRPKNSVLSTEKIEQDYKIFPRPHREAIREIMLLEQQRNLTEIKSL